MGRPTKGSPVKKRKTTTKAEKDPNKPKRPTSSYFYYIADQRKQNEKIGKKVTRVAEWTKEVSALWRALTPTEKEPFDKLAAKDKARYVAAMSEYTGKDANKPKRPMSAYFLWLGDFRIKMKGEFAENKELLRAAGAEWKELDDTEKKPYEIRAEEGRKKYEVTMKDYHQKGGAPKPVAKKQKVEVASNGQDDDDDDDDEEDDDEEEDDDDEDEDDD